MPSALSWPPSAVVLVDRSQMTAALFKAAGALDSWFEAATHR